MGEEARTLVQIARQAELDYAVIPYTETFSRQAVAFDDLGERESTFDINLIIVNADTVPKFVEHVGPEVLQGRYNIGMWAWEVEDLPPKMARAAEHLDEIWSCSRFSAEAIARSVSCPVQALPLPVTVPKPPPGTRADLGLTDEFLFLFCFDFNSIFERKNALAVIDAFRRAFKPGEGAELLIKTINGDDFQDQLQRLHAASLDRPDVKVVDGYLQAQEQRVLMNTCDAYVSLHRSEGFGFTMAEAMALGKPVIATGYSGNMDFMTEANSYPVPFERVHVGPGSAPYPADSYWAQPDVAAAAERMRRVFDRPDEARKKSKQARQDIETRHTPELKAQVVLERLQAIREQSLPKTKRSSYTVLSYGEDSSGDGATVRDEILESRKRHTDRT
ncbi:MAG: glycosyltransferase [Acidobacteriota bacterium]